MKSIEIPLVSERGKLYRFFETVPGILSWTVLITPVVLSFINPLLAAYFILAYLLIWFIKALVLNVRMVQGYSKLNQHMSYDWQNMLSQLDNPDSAFEQYEEGISPPWHRNHLIRQKSRPTNEVISVSDLYQVVIVAVYNETEDIVGPTIESLTKVAFDPKKLIIVIAYEERGGPEVGKMVTRLEKKYSKYFYSLNGVMHPKDIPNEVIGKGGNITYAGKWIEKYLKKEKIQPKNAIVTTLDSDNRPHPQYFAALTYAYIACPDPIHASFQPISIFTNNIWDVPAPMRVIATGNSFWNIVLALRPHMLRNFASHSQSMQTVIDTDFWSVRTIVEDGHQYWRTYFRYDGNHDVHPILVPIYQDAVLSHNYGSTLKAQFIQVRRWAWGASDVAYVLYTGWVKKNHVNRLDLFFKTSRLIEGHLSWATAPLLLLLGAFIPLYTSPNASTSYVANQLPIVASNIQRVAMIGLFVSIYFSIRLLPPKPPRYKNRHRIYMLLQWVYLPLTTIIYSSFAALYSQTRLMFGRYLGKFDVTTKVVKK
jgi:hypothetical protein